MLQCAWKNNYWHILEEMTSTQSGMWDRSSGREQQLSVTSENKLCRITEGQDKPDPRKNRFFIVRVRQESENKNAV